MKQNIIIIIVGLALLCAPFHVSFGQGSRYTGSYEKSSPITYNRMKDLVIEGLEFTSNTTTSCITLYDCENVIIKNCYFGPSELSRAIYLHNCKNVTIIDCTFKNVQTGLRADVSQEIKFEHNDVTNILGKMKGATHNGNMVQFIGASGAGNSVSYNACENLPGESSTEDIINLYNSNGTPESPIIVKGNWIRGGGPSTSGGGINLGDGSGSYQIAEDNILVDPGQYGVGIAGGNNMTLRNNKIYAKKQSFTNVGIGAANWYPEKGQSYAITVANNVVNYTNKEGKVNSWWFYQNVEPIAGKETNKYDATLTAAILPDVIIGRARSSAPPTDNNEGSTTLPDDKTETTPDPAPQDPEENVDNTNDNEVSDSGSALPDISVKNDPTIQIYLDRYNRVCINVWGKLDSAAEVVGATANGTIIYRQSIKQFHTVLPKRPAAGTYKVLVKNGTKLHLKTLNIP